MRHRVDTKKLGRPTGHRMSMMRNLVTSFFERERIRTTLPKAKALRSMAERLITLAKRGELHHRRQVLRVIQRKSTVRKLFDKIAPRFAARKGGYTRILKVGPRLGDGAETAYLELIGSEFVPKVKKEKGKKGEKKAGKEQESKDARKEEGREEGREPKGRREKGGEKADTHAKTKQTKQHIKAPTQGQ